MDKFRLVPRAEGVQGTPTIKRETPKHNIGDIVDEMMTKTDPNWMEGRGKERPPTPLPEVSPGDIAVESGALDPISS